MAHLQERSMQRRQFFTTAGVGVAGAMAHGAALGQASSKSKDSHHGSMQSCASECYDCAQECDSCASHCASLAAKGKQDHLTTMQSCLDCADVCRAAGSITARGGMYASMICKACADVCDACAAQCEKHPDDEHMKKCAKACRDCAKECREMLSHAAHKESR
jgi:hypothetical protein